jgi:hypothetical protein
LENEFKPGRIRLQSEHTNVDYANIVLVRPALKQARPQVAGSLYLAVRF